MGIADPEKLQQLFLDRMDAEEGGTHAGTENKECKEGQGDLKATGEAKDHEPDASGQKQDSEKDPEQFF